MRLHHLLLVTMTLFTPSTFAQTPPGTDIWILPITQTEQGLRLGQARNLTNRPGYDNQPFFLPNGEQLLFTRAITTGQTNEDAATQTDIMLANIAQGSIKNLSNTAQSEYSPTLMPDGQGISMIRVNAQGQQHLWRYGFDQTSQTVDVKAGEKLLENEPVGYHAWRNDNEVVMFVLGAPHQFVYANRKDGTSQVIADDPGASMYRIPNTTDMSFSQPVPKDEQTQRLMRFSPDTQVITPLTEFPEGTQYYTWLANQDVVAASGTKIWHFDSATRLWRVWHDLSDTCPAGASRVASNAQINTLAVVCNRQ